MKSLLNKTGGQSHNRFSIVNIPRLVSGTVAFKGRLVFCCIGLWADIVSLNVQPAYMDNFCLSHCAYTMHEH